MNLQKLEKLEKDLERYQTRWQNEGFRKSAKPQIQQQHFEKVNCMKRKYLADAFFIDRIFITFTTDTAIAIGN